MFLGSSVCAQRYFHPRDLFRFSRCSSLNPPSSLKKPLYDTIESSLQRHISARYYSLTDVNGSLVRNCGEVLLDPIDLPPSSQESSLGWSACQGTSHPEEYSPPKSDSVDSHKPLVEALISADDQRQSGGPLPRSAKKPPASLYEKVHKHEEHKRAVRRLQREQLMGAWADDWEVPLRLLKKSHEAQDVERKEESRLLIRFLPDVPAKIRQRRADEIKPPLIWNAVTFTNYVEDLVTSSVDRLMQRQLYGGETAHIEAVAKIVEILFEDMGNKYNLTSAACNAALRFFYQNDMFSKARAIFDHMENVLVTVESETVEIMLRSAAHTKDLNHFAFILRNMQRRGFKPTERTWVALILAVEPGEVRKKIVQEMQEIGMLRSPEILKQVVALVIRDELASYISSGLDPALFVAHMDSKYGDQWVSVWGVNNLLYELGRTKDVKEVVGVLDILIKRGLKPDIITLNTLIALSSLQYQYDAIIDILRRFRSNYQLSPSGNVYQNLFKLAWRRRMYNCSRVIWRSACVESVASFQMQVLVHRSLRKGRFSQRLNEPQSRGQIWRASAGPVVVGVNPSNEVNQTMAQLLLPSRQPSASLAPEAQAPAEGVAHQAAAAPSSSAALPLASATATYSATSVLIAEDFATAGRYRLVRDLADLWSDALALDRAWQQTGVLKTKDAAWKRDHAIPIEVELISDMKVRRISPKVGGHAPPNWREIRREKQLIQRLLG